MLRELIAWVLNNYLGKYVGNLNTAQLTVALLSGEVELENLPLRRDALRSLGLPLEALSGSVGKIKLQVPVRQFRTAPWCILIERVYVVVGPINLNEWDADVEEQADLDYKLSQLDQLEAKWRAQGDSNADNGGYYASSYSGWMSYGTSLVTNIVENLQLKINDVHIRYEDSITVPNHRFACGVTIESLSAQSCDPNWTAGFTTNWSQHTATFKLVELQNFSLYWDPLNNEETFGNVGPGELAEVILKNKNQWRHSYLLSPVSAQARLKRDRSETPLRTRSRPRLVCDLIWNEVSLSVIDWQYNQMVECARGLDDIAKCRRFRLLRPRECIKDCPKAWWMYAARCHGYFIRNHFKFRNLSTRILEDKKYIAIYTRTLLNPNETLSFEDKDLKDKVEKERSFDEIMYIREYCFKNLPLQSTSGNVSQQNRGMLSQWFPQWWYSNAPKTSTEVTPTTTPDSLTDDESSPELQFEDEILNALAKDAVDTNSLFKRDAVFGKFDFTLKKGTLDICTGIIGADKKSTIELFFENLHLNVESRPRSGSHFIGLSLGTVVLKDQLTASTEFPYLIRPQFQDEQQPIVNTRVGNRRSRTLAPQSGGNNVNSSEPLFVLNYEQKPLSYNTDYRLLIKSQSLDVVYNTDALNWLIDFVCKPHQVSAARRQIEFMKNRTKMELIKNWENIIEGDLSERKTWTLEIDISAPQIIFAEDMTNKNGCVVVVDFGRLQLTNSDMQSIRKKTPENSELTFKDNSEEDEAFMTPCSTPPGSPSLTDSPTLVSAVSELPDISNISDQTTVNEVALHEKIYDRYNLDLTDLQVIVCKGKERLSFVSSKGTSTLHVLDRFSISLQVERRIVHTLDPQYPSLTLFGTLPKLIVHVNEYKIEAITKVIKLISSNDTSSPYKTPTENIGDITTETPLPVQTSQSDEDELQKEASKLVLLHFSIDQMILDVHSRGRSIAELQVTGVKAGLSKRSRDLSVTLSVHGLLLVDAIQSFGADFELLIASHRHVGMDSVSGSLKQSEPCSPSSPASPDPLESRRPTSPHTISRALSNLQRAISPSFNATPDSDALITVEVHIIYSDKDNDGDQIHLANIQFNNLDIIANQETIVELIDFTNRVFPKSRKISVGVHDNKPPASATVNDDSNNKLAPSIHTEITFDFHRLNVLVLRALMRDTYVVGRKVGTFTMSEARIHATLGSAITVEGSLGGLQVLDLTPEGINHQRILSVGKDPLTEPPNMEKDLLCSLTQEMYLMTQDKTEKALSFTISKNLNASVNIKIRMASVWYTHCARFVQELSWCATEFKQYIKNLARSIREKATDMALGLVQPRSDSLSTSRTSAHEPSQSPIKTKHRSRRAKRSSGTKVNIKLDVILNTPVLVVPRSSCSPQVFVAHLGKITVNNFEAERDNISEDNRERKNSMFAAPEDLKFSEELAQKFQNFSERNNFDDDDDDEDDTKTIENDIEKSIFLDDLDDLVNDDKPEVNGGGSDDSLIGNLDTYSIDIRNMNLYSLDTSKRKEMRLSALPRAEEFYSCQYDAIAVVHDTAIRLEITRVTESSIDLLDAFTEKKDTLLITGSVIKPLRLSLSRRQYEQLIETFDNIFKVPVDLVKPPAETISSELQKSDDPFMLDLDSNLKRRLFVHESVSDKKTTLQPKVTFELPTFIIQLQDERQNPVIEISFRDFKVDYETSSQYETNIQVSLRSILMEDLLCPTDSKHRSMVTSLAPENILRSTTAFSSHSCPNLLKANRLYDEPGRSLPEHFETGFPIFVQAKNRIMYPGTPPPSPQPKNRQDNLVIYSSLLVDPECPTFDSQYNGLRQSSSIDFNCLNLIGSVKSWFVVLNFFGLMSDDGGHSSSSNESHSLYENSGNDAVSVNKSGNSELEISVRSLTLVLIREDHELAKANVSNAHFVVSAHGETKTVEGRLGSVSLYDLTSHGVIYREKFVTSGNEALNFLYVRDCTRHQNERTLAKDATLKIHMSSVRYVHTKRFIQEIQDFFMEFSQLQASVMRKIKPTESKYNLYQRPMQLGLDIKAGSPIILLPMCAKSDQIILANLGEFSLVNNFHFSNDPLCVSIKRELEGFDAVLDVMMVDLVNTDLFTAVRVEKNDDASPKSETSGGRRSESSASESLDMGSYMVIVKGRSLLSSRCHLKLQIERNMDGWRTHNVPDISVQGTLSKLEADLSLKQYKLVRGFLSYNLGECLDDLYVTPNQDVTSSVFNLLGTSSDDGENSVWTNLSINLDLENVSVKLKLADDDTGSKNLACINFIKSFLKIDSFSDGSQDIDLVSQEILLKDSRVFLNNNEEFKMKNVFTNILAPIYVKTNLNTVQAEVHSRKRKDASKYIILLNNMRIMAILDWLENMRDFLTEIEEMPTNFAIIQRNDDSDVGAVADLTEQFELVLNITDSELIFVEKPYKSDTNAVILKSTTVLYFRPHDINKIMSINLNHLELFSCVLGAEEDTALSIIDPVTINADIREDLISGLDRRESILDIQLQKQLFIRLSYSDVKMFNKMLESLPKQTQTAKNNKELSKTIKIKPAALNSLIALGFSQADCVRALEACGNKLSESALWLTQNASPVRVVAHQHNPLKISTVELHGNGISICVIDDCKDADVPLLELSLSDLYIKQELSDPLSSERSGFKAGTLKGIFASDYFNRALSGWEPLIEPWKCDVEWNYSLGHFDTSLDRLHLKVNSNDLLKLNVTRTSIELFQLVKDNWMQDYYGIDSSASKSYQGNTNSVEIRRRSPFVPFAIKNETGVKLWFATLSASPGEGKKSKDLFAQQGTKWIPVDKSTTVPFSFGLPKKLRHHDSHKLNLHQIGVRVEGWTEVGPISVDRVGICFRHARHENFSSELPKSRIVFEVSLEGSAQKLITVRSALRLFNRLNNPILLKMDHLFGYLHFRNWPEAKTEIVPANEKYCVPLSHVHAYLYFKPLTAQLKLDDYELHLNRPASNEIQSFNSTDYWHKYESSEQSNANNFQFSDKSIHWDMKDSADVYQECRMCPGNRDKKYRILCCVKKEGYPSRDHVPGHMIILWPPLRIHNLLPCELLFMVAPGSVERIGSSETANIHELDLEDNVLELNITLDSYPLTGKISIAANYTGYFETEVKLFDTNNRLLVLNASIQVAKESGIQVTIYTQYWLINRTGLPLIYRQEGVTCDSSGQFQENEQARLVSPFLFSYSDPDGPRSLIVRLGKRYGMNPPWCEPFNLHKNILNRQLRSGSSNETFVIGIEIRRGKGRYSRTNIVTFSPRFQLYNRSSYKLQFVQKCYASNTMKTIGRSTVIDATVGCHLPFHWPRLDQEQELCIRLPEVEYCLWSGGVPINAAQSFYINIRDVHGQMYFLRLEIILKGATYFLLFGNAQVLPPPIRIDNYSEVAIKFFQPDPHYSIESSSKMTTVRPHSSIAYALDEPMGPQILRFEAPGNVTQVYHLRDLGQMTNNLTYENFIYIAFSGTFESENGGEADFNVDSQQLVLGINLDYQVVLVRKQPGDRSQLWRMNNEKQLEHEGSSPPREQGKVNTNVIRYVLDLEKPPQPMQYIKLVVRPANKQRQSTQTWRFTEEGRLMCSHSNMCVQASGGFFGLRPGSNAVLGMIVSDTHVITKSLVPIEQCIERQKLRLGSGSLSVKIMMDGPIKTIAIQDVKSRNTTLSIDPSWKHASHIRGRYTDRTDDLGEDATDQRHFSEFNIQLRFTKGVGISIVSCQPIREELAFVTLENIVAEVIVTPQMRSLDLTVTDMQIDNQLLETTCPIILFPPKTNNDSPSHHTRNSIIHMHVKMLPGPNTNAVIFEHLILSIRPISMYLEERLVLRFGNFIGLGKNITSRAYIPDESEYEAQNLATKLLAANAKRYYFGELQISPTQIRLSVITTSKLPPHLSELKKSLGLTLIKFEDALIEFKQFTYKHHFETLEVYWRTMKEHYKNELKWQAGSILGSVDILGNPLGLASDLQDGVSGLIFEGSVTSLVKNVTHGFSNSTAKLTGTISDGLGRVVFDEEDTEARQRILEVPSGANSTGEHLVAGFKGLGFGLMGGFTSIVKHTYVGAQADGVAGFISGLGKGIVGTVTKPVIGVLDFASETANAVRETSKSSNRQLPDRRRQPRCVTGAPGGLLPPFSYTQSKGQQLLFLINKRDFTEVLIAYEPCLFQNSESRLRLLVSSENVYVFSRSEDVTTVILSYNLSELLSCNPVTDQPQPKSSKRVYYIELILTAPSKTGNHSTQRRPKVRCQTEDMALKASRHINYAKSIYDERILTLSLADGRIG